MNKAMLTGFLIGTILVLTVWLMFFKGSGYSEPESPMNPQVISMDVGKKTELEGGSPDMVSDLHDDAGGESQSEVTVRIPDERPGPWKTADVECVADEPGADVQAQAKPQMNGALPDDSPQGSDHREKAVFWQGFSSRAKALKFARYVGSALNLPCEAEKTEKGYQVFFRYSDPADQQRKMTILENAGFLK
ncbi:hypothetical protein [Desulfobacter latus]|uniref:Uncharacterized protein n=1 Tax=Desulfobacter latus TaxID=2292 RepID=A0A850TCS8_9BACT|nr:hypothetical protein [Desulfobacter latus]NWH06578.1 hypothetical protein [Desulfobacter latus]